MGIDHLDHTDFHLPLGDALQDLYICRVQIQPRKRVLASRKSIPLSTRQHELDHTDRTDHTDHTDHADHTDREYVCPAWQI